jgi:hypothetical protein
MRKAFRILLAAFILSLCTSLYARNDWDKDVTISGVREIEELNYELRNENGAAKSNLNLRILTRYSKDGAKQETSWFNSDGSLNSKIVYHYDGLGNMIESLFYVFGMESTDRYQAQYDKRKQLSEYSGERIGGGLISRQKMEYDHKGRMTATVTCDENDNVASRVSYTYDSAGNCTSVDAFDMKGDSQYTLSNSYTSFGAIEDSVYRDAGGTVLYRTSYRYDEKGRMKEKAGYGKDGVTDYLWNYDWTDDGLMQESRLYRMGKGGTNELMAVSVYHAKKDTGNK